MSRPGPLALAALLFVACESRPEPPREPPRPVQPPQRDDQAQERARLRKLRLPRSAGCSALGADRDLAADTALTLSASERCKLLYPAGAVLTLVGPARALVSPGGESALILGLGSLELDLASGALTPESGFWFALPGARVELVEGGRLVARVLESGATHLGVVSGRPTLHTAEGVGTVPASSAALLRADGTLQAEPGEVDSMEEAAAWLARRPATSEDRSALAAAALVELRAELLRAESEVQRIESLSRQHEQAVARGEPGAMKLQAELARASGAALATRRGLRARAAAYLALTLPSADAGEGAGLLRRALALGD